MSDPRGAAEARVSGQVRAYLGRALRPYRWRLAAAGALALATTAAALAVPLLVRHAVDHGIRAGDAAAIDVAAVGLAGLGAAAAVLGHLRIRVGAAAAEGVLAGLRIDLYRAVCARSIAEVEDERQGTVLAALTADVEALAQAARSAVPDVVRGAALFVLAAAVLLVLSPLLAALSLVGVPLAAVAGRRFHRRSRVAYAELRAATAATVGALGEDAHGVAVTQAFGRHQARAQALGERQAAVLSAAFAGMWARNGLFPVLTLVRGLATVVVIGAGGWLALAGRVSVGTLAAFVLAVGGLFRPVSQLSQWFDTLLAARASLARVVSVIDETRGLPEPSSPLPLPRRGALELEEATFAYRRGQPVLHGVSLRVEVGERVALVGPTGAGKSTIARLLARLADPDEGAARFGEVDLRDAAGAEVRDRILVVAQEGQLFPGSLADNVRLAHPAASDEEVALALARVGALEWAEALPQGVATPIGTDGANLSGGQRQLLALARVALADPAAVILDEATSALDPGTEATVAAALDATLAGRAVVVIAHRRSTADRCDRIVVVQGGRIVSHGPPADVEIAARPCPTTP